MGTKKILFLVSFIIFTTLLFFGGYFDAGAAGECVMFPNSTWNGTRCVCDSGFFDTRCGQDTYSINCQSLGLCDGTWKGSCVGGETPSTNYGKKCEGTAEEKVCCVTGTTPPPGNCTGTCRVACLTGENPLTGPYPDCVASNKPECCVTGTTPPASGTCPTGYKKDPGVGVCFPIGTGLSEKPIADILRNLLLWIIYIFGFIAIGAFIISGIQYLVSAGDEEVLKTAKRNMKWALVGVIVALSAFVIVKAITAALQATTITF